jgi:hypothetical protein
VDEADPDSVLALLPPLVLVVFFFFFPVVAGLALALSFFPAPLVLLPL